MQNYCENPACILETITNLDLYISPSCISYIIFASVGRNCI